VIPTLLIDTGPLVSILNRRSPYHDWIQKIWESSRPPAITVESVLSEAAFLLRRDRLPIDPLFELLSSGALTIGFRVGDHLQDIRTLLKRYEDRPMSFADACLVRLAEINPGGQILTLDSDFRIYRKHGNKVIPMVEPPRLN
jgi:predicted nucleic acid-binding protein